MTVLIRQKKTLVRGRNMANDLTALPNALVLFALTGTAVGFAVKKK